LAHAAEERVSPLNVPAAQAATVAAEPVNPASARQSLCASEAAGELEFVGHEMQVSDVCVVSSLYLPTPHSVHAAEESVDVLNVPAAQAATVAAAPVNPASARQSSCASEAAGELLPVGHEMQVSDAWAVAPLYLPASQSVQPADSGSFWYFPTPQSSQASAEFVEALNVPAAQAATVAAEPVNPASARQSSCASEAAGELLPVGHAMQVSDVWAVAPLYLPLAHSSQDADATAG